MAGSIHRWPPSIIPAGERMPSHIGGNSTTNDRYMAAAIPAQPAQQWPRTRIHVTIATVMLVAMTSASSSGMARTADQPSGSSSADSSGPRTAMPRTIATIISR